MRFLMQGLAMLSDVLVITAVAWLVYAEGLSVLSILMAVAAFYAWQHSGGFLAWHPATIRSFLRNAKRLGL